MRPRYLQLAIREDLGAKMVFVGGPRQVGKTTLATMVGDEFEQVAYLNWDNRLHKRQILDGSWSPDSDVVILDEIHKYTKWKSLIKGYWDTRAASQRFIVTGSSRLDTYRRGGDSLMGRYQYYRLHPFSLREHTGTHIQPGDVEERPKLTFPSRPAAGLDDLIARGGFPEPLLSGSARTLRRWQQGRFERVFREDIRDVATVRALSQVELLGTMLPERVGAPLSYASVARDVEASPKSVRAWLQLLERNYFVFRVPPYSRRLHRALKKESKYYLWDWSEAPDDGPRFENLVAAHLLKYCHFLNDVHGHRVELHYLRDLEKREVDFLVTWGRAPWFAVECKTSPGGPLSSIAYFCDRLGVTARFVVTRQGGVDSMDRPSGVRTISADRFLAALV